LSENLAGLASLIRSESFFDKFKVYLKQLYKSHMEHLGWESSPNESSRTGTLRATIIGILGIAGDEDVLKGAYDRFVAFKEDPSGSAVNGDLQPVIFKCALRYNEKAVFAGLMEIYEQSTFPEEQRNCLAVMGRVKDSQLHASFWDYVLFSGRVRLQDIAFPLNALSGGSDEGGRASWRYFTKNHDTLHARLSAGPVWATCVGLSCRGLTSLNEANEVEQFFETKKNNWLGTAPNDSSSGDCQDERHASRKRPGRH
jgi:aminopeptidase N